MKGKSRTDSREAVVAECALASSRGRSCSPRGHSTGVRAVRGGAVIHTDRLDLIPMTPAFLRASIRGDRVEAQREIQLFLPEHWPDIRGVLELRLRQLESNPTLQPWLLRAIGLRSTREMIGHIGFHDQPGAECLREWSPGGVEYGFTVFPAHRRNGYAREASQALMQWAHERQGVTAFVLTIDPSNVASQALAAHLGFVRVGAHLDEVDGIEDVLVLNIADVA
jgi:[ribosomal protein S5]-alanine N-acetyltransferase